MVACAKSGTRNATLFREAVSLAELVAGDLLPEDRVWHELAAAARAVGLRSFEIRMTLARAFQRGMRRPRLPRDLLQRRAEDEQPAVRAQA
jgi:hypothetical protein